jgi:hypothetical protein
MADKGDILSARNQSGLQAGEAMGTVTFREALELIESLPEEERRDLIDIVKRRLIEERRDEIAKSIQAARGEFTRGEVKRGTVENLHRKLPE